MLRKLNECSLRHGRTLDATREWLRVSTSVDSESDYEYSDGPARTLAAATYDNTTGMTVESCISFCISGGYIYAGLEYSQVRTLIWDLRSEITYSQECRQWIEFAAVPC